MVEQINAAERLLNLVIALVNAPGRITKEQVRRAVAGYADAPSDEAFERLFERDKDTLRELGVPVVTVTDPSHGDDVGYRIDTEAYELPAVDLTPAELGVLAVATDLWSDRAQRQAAGRGLTKLRAVTGAAETDVLAGLAARVHPGGQAFGPLLDAVAERQEVAFTYRAASTGAVRTRRVQPWRLLARRGGWVLVGLDLDRAAPRSFRLARIHGAVRRVGEPGAFAAPDAADVAAATRAWDDAERGTALLAVAVDRAAALRARALAGGEAAGDGASTGDGPGESASGSAADAGPGRDLVRVPYASTTAMAEELLRYGDAVVVLGPPALRTAVLDRLRAAAGLGVIPGPSATAGPGATERPDPGAEPGTPAAPGATTGGGAR